MSSTITIIWLDKSENVDPNSKFAFDKLDSVLQDIEIKSKKLKLTEKQFATDIGFSHSTVKKYRDDIYTYSPYDQKI